MKILLFLFSFMYPIFSYSQDTTQVVLFERESNPKYSPSVLIFQDSLACDTLQGIIIVDITFNKNINDSTGICAKYVEINRFELLNQDTNISMLELNRYEEVMLREDEIKKKYIDIFIGLYMKQPYNDLKGKEYHYGNKLRFMSKFIIVPALNY